MKVQVWVEQQSEKMSSLEELFHHPDLSKGLAASCLTSVNRALSIMLFCFSSGRCAVFLLFVFHNKRARCGQQFKTEMAVMSSSSVHVLVLLHCFNCATL